MGTLSSAGTGQSSTSISGHATSRAAFIVLPVTDLLQHQLRTTHPPHTHLPLWCTMHLLCTTLPLHHMCTLPHTQVHHTQHHSQPHTRQQARLFPHFPLFPPSSHSQTFEVC